MLGSNIGNIYIYTLNTNDGDRIKKKEEEKKGKRKRKGKAPLSTPRDTKGQNAGEKKKRVIHARISSFKSGCILSRDMTTDETGTVSPSNQREKVK